MTTIEEFQRADRLFENEQYKEAAEIYADVKARDNSLAAYCSYRLAGISNIMGDPMAAYELYYEAFNEKPNLGTVLYSDNHPSSVYVFGGKKREAETEACPLCGNRELRPKWCCPLSEAESYNSLFNPIRLWIYCEPCHHMVAKEFPAKLFLLNDSPREPKPAFFRYYSEVLDRISRYTEGMSLFEAGIGACECLLAAREIGFEVSGIDVIDKHVAMAREKYGLDAETADIVEYEPGGRKFDIIIMGDVIEHVSDPVQAISKAREMLSDGGAIWVSTPNFESAYAIFSGHNDPMRFQQYHLNYFSRESFYLLLDKCGLKPVDYSISDHYTGSMEVIAVKK